MQLVMEILQNLNLISAVHLLAAVILTSLLVYLKKSKNALKRENFALSLPGPRRLPFFGNALSFVLHPEDFSPMIFYYTKKYGSRYRLWIGKKLILVLSNPDDAEEALKGSKFLNKGVEFHDLFGRLFGHSTFSGEGAKWKNSRKVLQHPLKTNVLQNYIDIMNNEVNKVIKEFEPMSKDSQSFDVADYIGPVTFNIICKALYDLEEDVSKEDYFVFRQNAAEFLDDSWRLLCQPKLIRSAWQLLSKNKLKQIMNNAALAHQKVSSEKKLWGNFNIDESLENSNKKFINYLMDPSFTEEDRKREIITYSVGGSETSTVTISFALLLLGIYPDIQEKVQEELDNIFGDSERNATADDIKKMYYLEQVLKETLRLYPLVPLLVRTANVDTAIGDIVIPAGTEVIFNVLELHKNPYYFPDPDSFNPDHFSREKSQEMHKGCFMAFVIGPRNCIGKAFAMYEMKLICSAILRKYRIHSTTKKDDIKIRYSFVSTNANGFKISISRRNET